MRDTGGAAAKDGDRGSTRQGSPGAGSGRDTEGKQPGDQVAAQQEDEGSSPLIPILIAIAVLAAISVAVVTWQRRRGQDAEVSVSPRAS